MAIRCHSSNQSLSGISTYNKYLHVIICTPTLSAIDL